MQINTQSATPFPDENVSSVVKASSEWLLRYCKAAMGYYSGIPTGSIGWSSRDQWANFKAYAYANQPVDKYKNVLTPGQDPSNNQFVIDWTIQHFIPKVRRIALGNMEKQYYDLIVDPIDPLAKSEIDDMLLAIKAKLELKAQLSMMGMGEMAQQMPLQKDNPDEPEDLDGLTAMSMGTRHRTAMEMEQVVQLVFNANDYEQIQKDTDQDLFDYGFACTKDFQNGNCVGIRRCIPERMVMNWCAQSNFAELKYIGEIQFLQAYQVVSESNGQVTQEQITDVWNLGDLNNAWAKFGLSPYLGNSVDFYAAGQVPVLDLEIYTTDTYEKEERKDIGGNMRFLDPKRDATGGYEKRKNYEYPKKSVQQVYRAKWVVGTDIIYDYGQQYNIKRDPSNSALAIGSYHPQAVGFYNMQSYSMTKALISFSDNIQLATYKLQHAMNSAIPSGYEFNLDILEALDLSAGGQKMAVFDVVELFVQRGWIFTRSIDPGGQKQMTSEVVRKLQTGLGEEISEYWNTIQNNLQLMSATLGLNELTDGSTPDSKTLTTVANLAAQGTNNSMSDLYYAKRKMTENLAKSVIIRAQDIIHYGNPEEFAGALGIGTVTVLKQIKDIYKYIYSVSIKEKPTTVQVTAFQEAMNIAIKEGQITVADQMVINGISNYKQKELYLAYRVKKNAENKQQEALQMQQQNGQIQQQSAQVAEQAKQQTLQLDYELKSKLQTQIDTAKERQIIIEGQYTLEKERLASSGRVEASFVQAKSRDESNMRDNTEKLISGGNAHAIPVVNIPADLQSRVEPITTPEHPELPIDFSGFSFLSQPTPQEQPQPQEAA